MQVLTLGSKHILASQPLAWLLSAASGLSNKTKQKMFAECYL